jgi:hypothetical protein
MLSKEEAKQYRIDFWSHLASQMDKMRNPHGTKVDWMNYNTGIKHIYFRMEADEEGARLCIDIQFPEPGLTALYYEQFTEYKTLIEGFLKTLEWKQKHDPWNGKTVSRLFVERKECHLFNKEDWDKMHLFLKLNFGKLDQFWCEYGDAFKALK